MKTVGIIAEYNPFHSGHAFQISEARRFLNADRIVVIMSGSFVQRGEPACADKFTRARWAVENGADMVIELPDVYSLSCAERFASGAVRILKGIGMIDALCFGSESGDIEYLRSAANTDASKAEFDIGMDNGLSYPKALSNATGKALSPNDILGVEYIRAVERYSCGFGVGAVKRDTGYNDCTLGGEYSSALAIRNALSRCSLDGRISPAVFENLSSALPRGILEEIASMIKRGVFPSTCEVLSDAVLYRIRCMTPCEISKLPEVSEGLENLILKCALNSSGFFELMGGVKSKRYTMARLKRTAMCALLGITKELQDKAFSSDAGLYVRVLAVRESSAQMLSDMSAKASIPIIIKASDRKTLSEPACEIERISSLAHSVRALGQPYEKGAIPDGSNRLVIV